MIDVIPISSQHVFGFRLRGRLGITEYQDFLPILSELIRDEDKISLFVELEDFRGWDWAAAKEDYQFGIARQEHFERVAIVGEKTWQRWMTALANPFVSSEVRYFNKAQKQEAWEWLEAEPEPETVAPAPSKYRHILLATDFSPAALQATMRAQQLAQETGASLTLLHVIEDPLLFSDYPEYATYDLELEKVLQERAQKNMAELIYRLDVPNIETSIQIGVPSHLITEFAQENETDLIITAHRGRRGLGRLLGSTATAVQSHATCDVLTIRATAG
jgi:universal stress protein A